ncbi:MAG: class I SAM-dependent DNA methyltransferase [Thermoplasmata archaeon]
MSSYDRWARYYDLIYEGLNYEAHCDILRSMFRKLGVPDDGRVLDLGCGTGGHSIPLARGGYRVTGVDHSRAMVEMASEKAGDVSADFLCQDMRRLHVPGGYDAAICMFGGFGHMTKTADMQGSLQGVSTALHPRGPFIFECWNVGGVKPEHSAREEVEREDLKIVRLARSRFDSASRILEIAFQFTVQRSGRAVEEFLVEFAMRAYETDEIHGLLANADFEVECSYDGDALYGPDVSKASLHPARESSFRVLCVALKR